MLTPVQLAAQLPIHRRRAELREFIIDNSCPPTQIDKCQSYTSLNEASVMIKTQRDVLKNSTFHILGMFDLIYSGLLNDENFTSAMLINSDTAEKVSSSKERCNVLLGHLNLSTKDTNICQWSYTC